MPGEIQVATTFEQYCTALYDALVLAESMTAFGPGLSGMSSPNRKAYVQTYATVLWQERGHTNTQDLLPAVRRWIGRHKEFPRVAELAEVLDWVRRDRRELEIERAKRENDEAKELPASGLVTIEAHRERKKLFEQRCAEMDAERAKRLPVEPKTVTREQALGNQRSDLSRMRERVDGMRKLGDVAREQIIRNEEQNKECNAQ